MNKINRWVEDLDNADLGKFILRLALGIVFIYNGWFKIQNIEMVITGFGTIGIPEWMAYFVSYAEFIFGILMIVGYWVRHAGILFAIIMAVAIYKVTGQNGFSLATQGYEYNLVLLLMALAVTTLGAGKYTLARLIKK